MLALPLSLGQTEVPPAEGTGSCFFRSHQLSFTQKDASALKGELTNHSEGQGRKGRSQRRKQVARIHFWQEGQASSLLHFPQSLEGLLQSLSEPPGLSPVTKELKAALWVAIDWL